MKNMKIISWNVNGIRAIIKKNFINDINKINADIICLQETKANVEETKNALSYLMNIIYMQTHQKLEKVTLAQLY